MGRGPEGCEVVWAVVRNRAAGSGSGPNECWRPRRAGRHAITGGHPAGARRRNAASRFKNLKQSSHFLSGRPAHGALVDETDILPTIITEAG